MKTLKQKFREECFLDWQTNLAIRLVREWLQQKQKEIEIDEFQVDVNEFIFNELLEELKQK